MQALGVAYFIWMGYQAETTKQKTEDFLVAAFLGTILVFLLVKLFRHSPPSEKRAEPQKPPQLKPAELPKPDTNLKESDPRIEIEFRDERHATALNQEDNAWFTPVNRGQGVANFVCFDPMQLRDCIVLFPTFGNRITTGRSDPIRPRVTGNDGSIGGASRFLAALFDHYNAIGDPKLHEFTLPIVATYQDDFRNLFETRGELVFNPSAHVEATTFGRRGDKVIEVRNQNFRKIAAVI